MARKDPFRTIAVRRKILEALEQLRVKESEGRLKPYSVNEFCEEILWKYADGKIGYLGKDAVEAMNRMARHRANAEVSRDESTQAEFGSERAGPPASSRILGGRPASPDELPAVVDKEKKHQKRAQ